MAKIKVSDIFRKHLKIVAYLVGSGGLGLVLSFVLERPELAVVFGGAINYVIFSIEKELKNEGIRTMIKR